MLSDPKMTAKEISTWMKIEMNRMEKDTFVLGVSGGIDSAVSYKLAKMTGLNIKPIFLPRNVVQAEEIGPRVKELLGDDAGGLIVNEIELLSWTKPLLPFSDERAGAKAVGNFHARIRMATLYYYAELFGGIVLGTTNWPEYHIGYFTKWGDGAVDTEPLRRLLKEEVYQLARDGFEVPVPDSILNAKPSAELWVGQTDEGELGFTYDDIDSFLKGDFESLDPEVVQKIRTLHRGTSHKRNGVPFCDISGRER